MDQVQINMNNRKIIILSITVIVIVAVIVAAIIGIGKKNTSIKVTDSTPTPTKEVEFVVIRVLPSGFSPKEVTIKKGMIVRFTNPLDKKVTLKWDGETQYTSGAVFEGSDIATTVFDTEGEYKFSDDASKPHTGKVVVK